MSKKNTLHIPSHTSKIKNDLGDFFSEKEDPMPWTKPGYNNELYNIITEKYVFLEGSLGGLTLNPERANQDKENLSAKIHLSFNPEETLQDKLRNKPSDDEPLD